MAYESIATLGSTPKAAAVSADWMAIVASSSLVGLELIAQSPYTSTLSGKHMKNTLETNGKSGGVCPKEHKIKAQIEQWDFKWFDFN